MRDFQLVDKTDLSSPRKQRRVSNEHFNKTHDNSILNNKPNDVIQINKINIANDLEKLEEKYLDAFIITLFIYSYQLLYFCTHYFVFS